MMALSGEMPVCEHVVADYQTLRLSLKAHPLSFLRASMTRQGYRSACDLAQMRNGQVISIAGLVLVRQRPGSAKGVCFITLEDETGNMNIVIWKNLQERCRKTLMQSKIMLVKGVMECKDSVIHVIAGDLIDCSDSLKHFKSKSRDFH